MNDQQDDVLSLSVREFLANTASKAPTPGGGSVAGVTGALATSLGEMTLNFTRGKKKFQDHAEYHEHLATRLERMRGMFMDLVHDDIAAYTMYSETSKMEDGPEKEEQMELAVAAAINVPMEVAKLAIVLLEDLLELSDKCNQYLVSDLVAAGALANATVVLCDLNVRINTGQLDASQAAELRESSTGNRDKAAQLAAEVEAAVAEYL